ncbi:MULTISPECIES: hypothetical protein [Clostridia]|nr:MULTISPECIES: hypothetical protein [Clostridia]
MGYIIPSPPAIFGAKQRLERAKHGFIVLPRFFAINQDYLMV